MNKTEEFIELYKQLEELAIKRYGYPSDGKAISNLEKRTEFRGIKDELAYCREVRNLLQHKPKIGNSYAVEPSDEMIMLLKTTANKVQNPPRAKDIAIPMSTLCYKTMADFVRPAMLEMQENIFTHIPILEDGIVIGVFSENTLMSYIVDEEIVGIEDTMRFSDLKSYLPLDKHRAETFRFVRSDKPVAEISLLFEQALAKQDRIGLVFVTRTGKSNEPLLGILTAWDVAGAK